MENKIACNLCICLLCQFRYLTEANVSRLFKFSISSFSLLNNFLSLNNPSFSCIKLPYYYFLHPLYFTSYIGIIFYYASFIRTKHDFFSFKAVVRQSANMSIGTISIGTISKRVRYQASIRQFYSYYSSCYHFNEIFDIISNYCP